MEMIGKTGTFTITVDRVIVPRLIYAERRKDFVDDLTQAYQLMNDMQDKALEQVKK